MRKNWYCKFAILIVFFSVACCLLMIEKNSIDAKQRPVLGKTTPKPFSKSIPLISLSRSSTEVAKLSSSDTLPSTVTLFLSGGELGYLKPCGCSEGQVGGISRRDSLLTKIREQGESVLPIANGNLILDASRQSEIKADIGFFALMDMGYIAYNVGQHDLQLGITYLTSLSEQNKLPLISANLYRGVSRVFQPYILHTVGSPEGAMTIAIIGLISPNHAIYAQNLDLKIVDPKDVLKPIMSKLIEEADVIVCLFNGTTTEAATLRSSYPTLDVVVLSNEKNDKITSSSAPPLVNIGTKGKVVHSVQINKDIAGKLVVKKSQRHLLHEKIPDSPRMIQLLELYQEMLAAEDLVESTPQKRQKTGLQFVGTAACKTCHIDVWKSWKETKHAHAYHTLEIAGHETDPECLTCHTVGFSDASGFISVEKTPNHLDVGCENCHGAGSVHAENPERKGYGIIKEKLCVTCHTTENSPKFDIRVYFPKIVHSAKVTSAKKKTK